MKFDVDQIREKNKLSDVVGKVTRLTKRGASHTGLCPFHNEKTPSFDVNDAKGVFYCRGCGAGGDVFDFVEEIYHLDFQGACEHLGGEKVAELPKREPRPDIQETSIYDDLEPVAPGEMADPIEVGKPVKVWNVKTGKAVRYWPKMVFPYHDAGGELIGYVLRLEFEEGKKVTPTLRFGVWPNGTGEIGWMTWPFDEPRPLYGLEQLTEDRTKQVVVAEGEKAKDAAQRLLGMTVLTWPGGGKSVAKADWTPLAGRPVVCWGDADQEGEIAIEGKAAVDGKDEKVGLAAILHSMGCKVKVIAWDKSKEKGWDAADAEKEGWTRQQTLQWLKAQAYEWPKAQPPEPPRDEPPPADYDGPKDEAEISHQAAANPTPDVPRQGRARGQRYQSLSDEPFSALGHNKGVYYYLSHTTGQIVDLTASAHQERQFMQLAELGWWMERYPTKKSTPVDWTLAANDCIKLCHAMGIFSPDRLRGRGAWEDEGRAVVHLGSHLLVDGTMMHTAKIESRQIYEATMPLQVKVADAISAKAAIGLYNICKDLSWSKGISGALLAGWCVIAPVCGILPWRPHIWVTGEAGSGKTTVVNDIIGKVVGPYAILFQGKTTEAGIRQELGSDARPVILDEAEGEDQNGAQRMQNIIDFARVASSGGIIAKGTTSGQSLRFQVRSALCFSSINPSVSHFADETRISKLALRRNLSDDAEDHFRRVQVAIKETLTPEFSAGLFARTVDNMATLLKNIEIFTIAATRHFKSRRTGDQYGGMLAGLYLLHSDKEITIEAAELWIQQQDWSELTAPVEETQEQALLNRISSISMQVATVHGMRSVTVGQAIEVAADIAAEDTVAQVSREEATVALKAYGVILEIYSGLIFIANKSDKLNAALKGTPWHAGPRDTLIRLKGASPSGRSIRFGTQVSHAIMFPLAHFGIGPMPDFSGN